MVRTTAIAFLAIAALGAGAARAQLIPDSSLPVDITGDTLEIVDDVATWTGDVRAMQGEAVLTADRLVATLDEDGGFSSIRAIGNVRYSNGNEAITGGTAHYDAASRTITLTENVVVTQGKTVMTGGALVYWPDTGRLSFTAPGGKRIRGIFHAAARTQRL